MPASAPRVDAEGLGMGPDVGPCRATSFSRRAAGVRMRAACPILSIPKASHRPNTRLPMSATRSLPKKLLQSAVAIFFATTLAVAGALGTAAAGAAAIHLGLGVASLGCALLGSLVGVGFASLAWSKFLTGAIAKPDPDLVVLLVGVAGFLLLMTVAIRFHLDWLGGVLIALSFAPAGLLILDGRSRPASRRASTSRSPTRTRVVASRATFEPHTDTIDADECSEHLGAANHPKR
jgi:hypothetical protein